MLTLSTEPEVARQQMLGFILYLSTYAGADGEFDDSEREFIRRAIRMALDERYGELLADAPAILRDETINRLQAHFEGVLDRTINEIEEMTTESVGEAEDNADYVLSRLKVRCFEVLQTLDRPQQKQLIAAAEALIGADGHVHAAEQALHDDLAALLAADRGEAAPVTADRPPVVIEEIGKRSSNGDAPAFLRPLERHYSAEPTQLAAQLEADRQRALRVMDQLDQARAVGNGRLTGKKSVQELPAGDMFLDGYTWVVRPAPGQRYELTVIGDLHGCYSCLKAALVQSQFFDKLDAYNANPHLFPKPLLVFLGDYIDRGIYSYDGVLRTVLETYLAAPDHVVVLRGNHEWYISKNQKILPAVGPSEAYTELRPLANDAFFKTFYTLFESLPVTLLFDKMCFVHAGAPPDSVFKEHYEDLSSLNKWPMRFYMMWGDPSAAAVIPPKLQKSPTARFAYGRLQAQGFFETLGTHAVIRGHEVVHEGFRRNYDDGPVLLYTVFSSGGANNADLPRRSNYRRTTPMALTVHYGDGEARVQPWAIDYERFNDPATNAFYATPRPLSAL
ncbi:MAG: serine/threonine protein phosphatase [Deltaproteobacteria bacterium]|nr:MAG: serine/threonine protein phosphatase [Deltaproteobacteria bacterium]